MSLKLLLLLLFCLSVLILLKALLGSSQIQKNTVEGEPIDGQINVSAMDVEDPIVGIVSPKINIESNAPVVFDILGFDKSNANAKNVPQAFDHMLEDIQSNKADSNKSSEKKSSDDEVLLRVLGERKKKKIEDIVASSSEDINAYF